MISRPSRVVSGGSTTVASGPGRTSSDLNRIWRAHSRPTRRSTRLFGPWCVHPGPLVCRRSRLPGGCSPNEEADHAADRRAHCRLLPSGLRRSKTEARLKGVQPSKTTRCCVDLFRETDSCRGARHVASSPGSQAPRPSWRAAGRQDLARPRPGRPVGPGVGRDQLRARSLVRPVLPHERPGHDPGGALPGPRSGDRPGTEPAVPRRDTGGRPRCSPSSAGSTRNPPSLPVVAAGSLLEMSLGDEAFGVPVGRVSFQHVEPMGFAEFLEAHGQLRLQRTLAEWRPRRRPPAGGRARPGDGVVSPLCHGGRHARGRGRRRGRA